MTSTKTLLPLFAAAICLSGCVYEEYAVVEESPRRVYHGGYVERDVVVERRPAYDYDDRRRSYYDDRPRAYYDDRPRAYGGGGVTLQTTRSYNSRAQVYHDHDAHERAIEKRRDDDDRKKEQSKKKDSDDRKKDSDERRFEPRIKTRLDQMHTVIAGPRGQPHKPDKDKDKDDDKKKKKD